MGIATVHYLSMNVRDGRVSVPSPSTQGIEYTFNVTSLQPSTDYVVVWGDESADSEFTTDASGNESVTHTYVDAGAYTISVKLGTKVVATNNIVVGYDDGTITADDVVVVNIEQTFSLASLAPSYEYVVDWGDESEPDTVTTDSSGEAVAAHTYDADGEYTIQVLVGTHVAASVVVEAIYEDGTIVADGDVVVDVEETFTLASLSPEYEYVIDWGDESTNSTVTTDIDGGATAAHTFTAADTYTVQVLTGTHVSASVEVTVITV